MAGAQAGGNTQAPNFNNLAAQGMQAAQLGTLGGMNYQPMNVRAPMGQATTYNAATMGNVPQVQAGQISATDMSQYMNPYEQNVIGGLQSDAQQNLMMGSNQLGAQATAAKAFGGSRHGVAEGVMQAEAQRNLNSQIGQLRQAGFQNAQNVALSDIGNRMQAGLANQGAALNVGSANMNALNTAGQFGAGAYNTMSQANQNAMMQAQLANQNVGLSGAQMNLGAANQMGGISQNMYNMARTSNQDMMQQGLAQQAMNQAIIDAGKQQYAGYTGAPQAALGYLSQALGSTPVPQTTTNSKQAGLFDYLTLAASGAGAFK